MGHAPNSLNIYIFSIYERSLPHILVLHFPGSEASKELYIYALNSFGSGSTPMWGIKAKLSANVAN